MVERLASSSLVVVVLVLLLSTWGVRAEEEAMSALDLTEDNFKDKVGAGPHFVMFFAPWCGHCKRLAPVWEELAVKYNKKEEIDCTIGKVDCTQQTALCSAQDVTGYPTLKFFKNGYEKDDGIKYRGDRDLKSLEKFIEGKLGNEIPEEKPKEPESSEAVVENGLYILSAASFAKTIEAGDTFVKFYAPWCGHCQKLAPTWEELAKVFEKEGPGVKVAKLDCTQHQAVCQEQDVRGYPTLQYFRNGRKMETYKGARSLSELKDFVDTNKVSGTGSENENGKVPEAKEVKASPVLKLEQTNFESEIETGVVFVKFFAPWCGHCKRLAPTWEQLAEEFSGIPGVKIAHVDCTAGDNINRQLCDSQGVNGFPTLIIYNGGKKVDEYNGKRDLGDLKSFVEKHMAAPGGGDDADKKEAKDEL